MQHLLSQANGIDESIFLFPLLIFEVNNEWRCHKDNDALYLNIRDGTVVTKFRNKNGITNIQQLTRNYN